MFCPKSHTVIPFYFNKQPTNQTNKQTTKPRIMHSIVLVILLLYITTSEGFLPSSLTLGKCCKVGQEEKVVVMRAPFRLVVVQNIIPLPSQTSASATTATRQPSSDHEPFVLATEEEEQQQQPQQRIRHYCRALGGEIRKIKLENDDDGFLTKLSVPTFATFEEAVAATDPSSFDNIQGGDILQSENNNTTTDNVPIHAHTVNPTQKNDLDGIIPGAFLVENAIHPMDCESIIEACEKIGFGKFNAGKNNHGAMQILVTEQAAHAVGRHIFKYLDVDDDHRGPYQVVGLNQRWRIYRYEAGGEETFAPHIDAGFPPSALSKDGTTLIWDASSSSSSSSSSSGGGQDQQGQYKRYPNDTVSRLTVLMYLNDDFEGGHTNFYAPLVHSKGHHHLPLEVIASITPKTGSILLFPQAVGEEAVEYARQHWPLHEGSPVFHGRPKYVIRSDVLFAKVE